MFVVVWYSQEQSKNCGGETGRIGKQHLISDHCIVTRWSSSNVVYSGKKKISQEMVYRRESEQDAYPQDSSGAMTALTSHSPIHGITEH